jgi:hypothetical protein
MKMRRDTLYDIPGTPFQIMKRAWTYQVLRDGSVVAERSTKKAALNWVRVNATEPANTGPLGIIRRTVGKFDTLLDSYLWELSLEGGPDAEAGYPDGGGWFGLMRFDPAVLATLQNIAATHGDQLTEDEIKEIDANVGVILFERSDGIVEAAWYDDQAALEADWNNILADVYGDEDEGELGETIDTFHEGDSVRVKPDHWTGIGVDTGVITSPGREQSLVRFDDGVLVLMDNRALELG